MPPKVSRLGVLALAGLLPAAAHAQYYQSPALKTPLRVAPDACGPGFYSSNPCGCAYGPNYYLLPPWGPENGPGMGYKPEGQPGGYPGQPGYQVPGQPGAVGGQGHGYAQRPGGMPTPPGVPPGMPPIPGMAPIPNIPPMAQIPGVPPQVAGNPEILGIPFAPGLHRVPPPPKGGIPAFPNHPYARSPRDFFMWGEAMESEASRLRFPALVP